MNRHYKVTELDRPTGVSCEVQVKTTNPSLNNLQGVLKRARRHGAGVLIPPALRDSLPATRVVSLVSLEREARAVAASRSIVQRLSNSTSASA